jgi:rhodanese-related sulfurtransferase
MSIHHKLKNNVFFMINSLAQRVARVEQLLVQLEAETQRQMAIQRNHLVRVKNQEPLTDDFLQNGRSYYDLTPEKAWELFKDKSKDFIFLDVSYKDYAPEGERPIECLHIPLEELEVRWQELPNKSTPIFVISEEGLRSILACDFLNSKGYFNCNNISGGWKFWPGHRLIQVKTQASA